jgi:hypothetical protein
MQLRWNRVIRRTWSAGLPSLPLPQRCPRLTHAPRSTFSTLAHTLAPRTPTDTRMPTDARMWHAGAHNDTGDTDGYNVYIDRPAFTRPASRLPPAPAPWRAAPPSLDPVAAAARIDAATLRDAPQGGALPPDDAAFPPEALPPQFADLAAALRALPPEPRLPVPAAPEVATAGAAAPAVPGAAAAAAAPGAPNLAAGPAALQALPPAVPAASAPAAAQAVPPAAARPAAVPLASPAAAASSAALGPAATAALPPATAQQAAGLPGAAGSVSAPALAATTAPPQSGQLVNALASRATAAASSSAPTSAPGAAAPAADAAGASGRRLLVVEDQLDAFR